MIYRMKESGSRRIIKPWETRPYAVEERVAKCNTAPKAHVCAVVVGSGT